MPEINMSKIFKSIKQDCKGNDEIQNLKVPSVVGGRVNMILGIRYQNIYPEQVHKFPSGLTVFKSQLLPATPGAVACIGGPVSALDSISSAMGGQSAIRYMSTLIMNINSSYKPRLDFFPELNPNADVIDPDILDVNDIDINADKESSPVDADFEDSLHDDREVRVGSKQVGRGFGDHCEDISGETGKEQEANSLRKKKLKKKKRKSKLPTATAAKE